MARVIVAGKYQLLKKIGAGSFGKIFSAKDISASAAETEIEVEKEYAVKIMTLEHTALLQNEVAIYEKLREIKNIPTLYAYGIEGKFNYMVMDLLEQSAEQLRMDYGDQISLKVVLHLATQMLTLVEQIHAYGILHRDLKPANFLLKTNAQQISELYLIDFGLAKCFLDEKSRHLSIKTNEVIVGTQRYMSINTHQGLTASRRDDLESIGYIIIFLYHGQLSWQNQKSISKVVELKQKLDYSDTIGEFVLFVRYCRNLGFTDKPNYAYLRGMLENLNKL
jgi:serine/threonine protein kinase